MTTPMRNRMRHHTRPADYVSKSRQAEAVNHGRPGGCSFSFTGEFPDIADQQPVEATGRRRNYTANHHTGSYQAVHQDDTSRMPAINRHGVSIVAAAAMLAAMIVVLGGIVGAEIYARYEVQEAIASKQAYVAELKVECKQTEDKIITQSSDVNISQGANLLGMVKVRSANVHYLEAPADAVITMADQTAVQSFASIWGQ